MFKAQRIILNLLSVLFLAMLIALLAQNMDAPIILQVWSGVRFELSLGLALGISALLTAFACGFRMAYQMLTLNQKQKRVSRELERKDVSHEEAESKVKVLENKIQTLEKALSEALKKS